MPRVLGLLTLLLIPLISTAQSVTDQPRGRYPEPIAEILGQRCMVCHGCYDAPCQLKLTAPEGLLRGAHPDKVYDGTRLIAAELHRLFEDAQGEAQWRSKGFFPVIDTQQPEQGVLYRLLQLKQQHPLPQQPLLPASITLELNRDWQCARRDSFDRYADSQPLWGMPYGLPALSPTEHQRLSQWLLDGAPLLDVEPEAPADRQQRQRWEAFLNQDSLKAQLSARYLYEHLYLANLHFDDDSAVQPARYYHLVRSATPPGQPLQRISSRRPFDDPGVARVYYRLAPLPTQLLNKTHLPYRLDEARRQRWQQWFIDSDYTVSELPSYASEIASNPFVTFQAIPPKLRYRFLLDEAQFTIMNFIKGPVCRGQVALNVINDYFWVFFVNPDHEFPEVAEFLASQQHWLKLPSGRSNDLPLATWLVYAHAQERWLQAKAAQLNRYFPNGSHLNLNLVWDGDRHNPNASLTIFRHFDSATVVQGLVGQQPPKTAWLIDYPLLERIHYLLVAGFDVYGNVGHQLNTRLYMDFLRMEGEANFLTLLPQSVRQSVRDYWYRDASRAVKEYLLGSRMAFDQPSGIDYHTDQPLPELYQRLQQRLAPSDPGYWDLRHAPPAQRDALLQIANLHGLPASLLPQVTMVRVDDGEQRYYYTVLHNNAHSNITSLLFEENRRLPQEDTVTVANGLLGSYPDAFWRLPAERLPQLAALLHGMRSENHYREVMSSFGVRRTDPEFWSFSDQLLEDLQTRQPWEAGLLDYNRLENR